MHMLGISDTSMDRCILCEH